MQRRPGFPARLPQGASVSPVKPSVVAPQAIRPPRPSSNGASPAPRAATPAGLGLDSEAVRQRMVQKLAAGGITSSAVLKAMATVPRHLFVDSALVNQAYEDTSLPIGLGQTISKPSVVARMCELLLGAEGVRTSAGLGRVLEIGSGCGYQATVLSLLAREVYSVERLRGLYDKARENVRPLRLTNLHLILGDGMLGYPKGGPYAAIIAAAGGDAVPQAWCEQLAVGGRLVAPMALTGGQQMLLVIDRTSHGLTQSVLEPVHFVPLKSGIA